MHRKSLAFIAAAGLSLALGQIASAAELPVKPTYQPPPILAPTPVYNWTGFYVGGNLGGAWGNVEVTDVTTGSTISPDSSGFAGGGQVGFDYQMGSWVVGIRNVIDGTNLSKGVTYAGPTFAGTINGNTNWFDALTGRVGYLVQPNLLVYAQGGAAWAQWNVTFNNGTGTQVGELSGSKTGWTAGAGVECGAEYRHILAIVSRLSPNTRAASLRLFPSMKTNFRTAA
jgi:outer membrane immunogenic protein